MKSNSSDPSHDAFHARIAAEKTRLDRAEAEAACSAVEDQEILEKVRILIASKQYSFAFRTWIIIIGSIALNKLARMVYRITRLTILLAEKCSPSEETVRAMAKRNDELRAKMNARIQAKAKRDDDLRAELHALTQKVGDKDGSAPHH